MDSSLKMYCFVLDVYLFVYSFPSLHPIFTQIVTALTKGLVCGSCRRFAGMLVAGETDLKLHITGGGFSALQQESHITG